MFNNADQRRQKRRGSKRKRKRGREAKVLSVLDAYGNNNKVTSATLTTRTMIRRRKNARRVLYPAEGKHEDGPRYVAKGARIDPLVPSAPLPPCLSHRSYVPTRTDTQCRCYYRPPTPLLLPSFFLSCFCRSIPVILFLALSVYMRVCACVCAPTFPLSLSLSPSFLVLCYFMLYFSSLFLFLFLYLILSFSLSPPLSLFLAFATSLFDAFSADPISPPLPSLPALIFRLSYHLTLLLLSFFLNLSFAPSPLDS